MTPCRIRSVKKLAKEFVIGVYGTDTKDNADSLRGYYIAAERKTLPPLPPDEFFVEDLIGMTVMTTEGEALGKIRDIFETGSNDVYVVRGSGREYLIPAIRDVVVRIAPDEGVVTIRPLEGMLDLPE